MVGTRTVFLDNPHLTVSKWTGRNPIRIIIDKSLRTPRNYRAFDGTARSILNLDLLQQSDASFSCELKFHPSMTQFSEPEWEELKIEDNWELVYNIEREILSDNLVRSMLPFEKWIVR